MFKKFFTIFVFVFLLSGCDLFDSPKPITKQEYKMALGSIVCSAVESLNEKGLLANEEKFAEEFESAVREAVKKAGYSEKEWVEAKDKFFTSTEHEKLIKMHFTWCLIGNSIED